VSKPRTPTDPPLRPGCPAAGGFLHRTVLLAFLTAASSALAGEDAAPPPPPGPPPDLSPSLDFDLLPQSPASALPAIDPALDRAVARRRKMLTLHQGLGIATWATLAATTVIGQLDFDDRFRGGGDTGKWHGAHRALAVSASALFLGTGLLGLLAPEPYAKKARLDTATVHKVSMAIATLGMATQIVLGLTARGSEGSLRERDLATAHQITGYATLGAMTFGAVVLFF